MAEFWLYYKALVAQLYEPLSSGDGVSDDDVTSAEQRLGLRLPRLLREFYLLAGKRTDLNHASDKLVHPNDLQIEDEKLVFYVENQAACVWGVRAEDLDVADPPVVRGDSMAGSAQWVWEPQFERFSSFVLMMLCWQGIRGGMTHSAVVSGIDAQVEDTIGARWRALDIDAGEWEIRAYIGDGQILCWWGLNPASICMLAPEAKRSWLRLKSCYTSLGVIVHWITSEAAPNNGMHPTAKSAAFIRETPWLMH